MELSKEEANAQALGERLPIKDAPEAVRTTIFSFVSVRSPHLSPVVSAGHAGRGLKGGELQNAPGGRARPSGFIFYDPDRHASSFYQQLADAAREVSQPADERAQRMRDIARARLPEITERKQQALANVPDLVQLGNWLKNNQYQLNASLLHYRPDANPAPPEVGQALWDSLLAEAVLGSSGPERPAVLAALRADYFLTQAPENVAEDAYALRRLALPEVVMPAPISPLPTTAPAAPPQPDTASDAQKTRDDVAARQQALLRYQQAAEELRALAAVRLELARLTPVPDDLATGHPEDEAPPAAQARAAADTWQAVQQAVEVPGSDARFSEDTEATLREIAPAAKELRFAFLLEQLASKASQLNAALGRAAPAYRPVFLAGGAVWTHDAAARNLEANDGTNPTNRTDGVATDQTIYDEFYDAPSAGRLKPLGIADLNRVEQTLCCYRAGEVAHIENVMQGEYKERTTRRLRRSETTVTTEITREQTQEKDTTSTDRFDLTKASTQVINQTNALTAGVSATYNGPVTVVANANFSMSSSLQQTDQVTQTYAKSITDRSLQRVVERVREERVSKLIEEFEETNKHGLDNRGGTQHVVGLYRWVDQVYTAQVVNYGKRLMFEFMLPEPGNFHLWAMSRPAITSSLHEPLDPRRDGLPIADTTDKYPPITSYKDLSGATLGNYAAWAAAFGAQVEPLPADYVYVGLSDARTGGNGTVMAALKDLVVPEGYAADSYKVQVNYRYSNDSDPSITVQVGNKSFWFHLRGNSNTLRYGPITDTLEPLTGVVPVSYMTDISDRASLNLTLRCKRLDSTFEKWQIKTYNAILAAYEAKKEAYDNDLANLLAQQRSQDAAGFGTNPARNRAIEQTELKKGCIHWLFYGQDYSVWGSWPYGDSYNPPHVNTDADTLAGTERAKFIEQCFEWPLMTYLFYPYFWAGKTSWRRLYQVGDADPVFQEFLQAGLARVHVPVRPGYEKVAMHFLSSGEVWNGQEPPTSDSPLFLSIADELRQPTGTRVGQPWEVRVPTTLTVLQAKSGAIEGEGLPCDCDPKQALGNPDKPGQLTGQPA